MKKAVVGLVLAGIIVRLAVLAGAGEALADWAKEQGVDPGLGLSAAMIEFGGFAERPAKAPGKAEAEDMPAVTAPPAANAAEEGVEEAVSDGETGALWSAESAEEELPDAVQAVALTLSGSAVKNRTGIDVDLGALAAEGLDLRLEAGQPQALIFHTHSSEAYTQDEYDKYVASDPYRTEDKRYSVIRVGDKLAEKLESCGLTVLHDREIYDYPSYTGSYTRSGAAVEQYLKDYPSIRIVIDLHRDAIGSGDVVYKTNATLSGRSSAQVMLLVGTGENGLWHPYWRENLKLAMYLKAAADEAYPSLTRPIELVSERYNQQLSTGMMILEVGSSGNTLREALTAIELFGETAGEALAALVE